jgi:hypothetical protein
MTMIYYVPLNSNTRTSPYNDGTSYSIVGTYKARLLQEEAKQPE